MIEFVLQEHIDIGFNCVRERGAKDLALAIETRTISNLAFIISGNDIGAEGALSFASAAKNGRLRLLKLALTTDASHEHQQNWDFYTWNVKVLSLASNSIDCIGNTQPGRELNASLERLELQNNKIGHTVLNEMVSDMDCLTSLQQLDLSQNPLGDEASEALHQLLMKDSQLTSLNIAGCCLGRRACQSIASAIRENKNLRLQSLKLSSNNLCNHGLSYDAYNDLLRALCYTPSSIRELVLERNLIRTSGCWTTANMLKNASCALTILDISCNEISSLGASSIAKSLRNNKSLLALSLRSNLVDSSAASSFAHSLEENTTLQVLDLENNDIDEEGFDALALALSKNHSLQLLNVIMNEFDPDKARQNLQKVQTCEDSACAEVLLRNYDRVSYKNSIRGEHIDSCSLF